MTREIIVGIEESASYVQDMWPDEVEYLIAEARADVDGLVALNVERLAVAIKNVEWVRGESFKPRMDWFNAYARNIAIEYRALLEAQRGDG